MGKGEHGMSEAPPRVSVIIPTCNREHLLPASIQSVLDQDLANIEVIVVDDGSSDRTADVALSFGDSIKYVYQANAGSGVALNTGVSHSSAPLLSFLDDDNLWFPKTLNRQVAILDAQPEVEAVHGYVRQFYDDDVDEKFRRRHPIMFAYGPAKTYNTTLIRKQAFDRVGPFLTDIRNGVDVDWQLRAMEADLRSVLLPEVVLRRRVHSSNCSITDKDGNRERIFALKRSLDRRRLAARQAAKR